MGIRYQRTGQGWGDADLKAGPEAGAASQVDAYPWVPLLRSNCTRLYGMAAGLVCAVSVTTPLETGGLGEALAAHEASQRLAEEFGFTVSVQIEGTSLWVRFARCGCQSIEREGRGLCG